ncbi:lysophospholipase L1-like esterase [Rhodoblastus sphagnicola]|nr:GDSL-type esterase/lipase family protein [Rhodoblastus sphagnicola]MBB4196304.1 lysophospholipase L1-like esterase [Rhodoblastus sphagnicola]
MACLLAGALGGLAPACLTPAWAEDRCEPVSESLATPAPLPFVTAALARADKKLRLLIIGAAGGGRGARRSYPAMLESLLEKALNGIDVVVVNRPMSGETVGDARERIHTEFALQRPDLLIWQVGGNDALAHVDPGSYEDSLSDGVRWAKGAGADVLLVGFEANPWLHDESEVVAIREATRKVAAAENVFYVRRAEAVQVAARARARADLGDNPLPVETGGECLAAQVAQALAANLVLRRTRPAPVIEP